MCVYVCVCGGGGLLSRDSSFCRYGEGLDVATILVLGLNFLKLQRVRRISGPFS